MRSSAGRPAPTMTARRSKRPSAIQRPILQASTTREATRTAKVTRPPGHQKRARRPRLEPGDRDQREQDGEGATETHRHPRRLAHEMRERRHGVAPGPLQRKEHRPRHGGAQEKGREMHGRRRQRGGDQRGDDDEKCVERCDAGDQHRLVDRLRLCGTVRSVSACHGKCARAQKDGKHPSRGCAALDLRDMVNAALMEGVSAKGWRPGRLCSSAALSHPERRSKTMRALQLHGDRDLRSSRRRSPPHPKRERCRSPSAMWR